MKTPNKQVGWSNEANLLWVISKQLEKLIQLTGQISNPTTTTTTTT